MMSPRWKFRGWKFRGREAEQERLNEILDRVQFEPVRVSGRRQVGKTRFLQEISARRRDGRPAVMIELRGPREDTTAGTIQRLSDTASNAGFGLDLEIANRGLRSDYDPFGTLLHKLMNQGAVVVLDEFHHAKTLKIVTDVKMVIDHFKHERSATPPPEGRRGKLIITGSHQQKILDMFRDTEPLFERIKTVIPLRQWSLKTTLEMAADHGFLRYPGRFLSMYTAFGGLPGAWEQFATSDPCGRLIDHWESDSAWRQAFLAERAAALKDRPIDRWDNAAYVELSDTNRRVFDQLGTKKGGFTSKEIEAKLKMNEEDVRRSLDTLKAYLQLIESSAPYTGGLPCWRISDNPALFQISVFGNDSQVDEADGPRIRRLETLEGTMVERMAAAWARELDGVTFSKWGAWMPGVADIDVLAKRELQDTRSLITGGCKRNAKDHSPGELTRQFEAFVDKVKDRDSDAAQALLSRHPRRLLISPNFTPALRDQYAGSGYECVDILDMARSLGIAWEPARSRARPGPDPSVPSDAEIRAARAQRTQHQIAVVDFNRARTRLEREEQGYLEDQSRLEKQLAATGLFAWGRKRDLRAAMARAQDAAVAARIAIESLEDPPPLDPDVRTRARTPTQAEHQQQTARTAVRALEADARFFARQRDPESAGPRDHPPDRSCIFVVAKPEHVPPEDTEIAVRHWHHFAIWQPVHGAEELRILSAAFPDSVLAPAPEVRSVWPFSLPQPDGPQADAALQSWGVTDHIDRVKGRDDGGNGSAPPPPRRPDPEPSSGGL